MAEFGLGKFFLTSRAIGALTEAGQPLEDLLKRHESGDWGAALGDLALGYKQKLFHSLKTGSMTIERTSIQVSTSVPNGCSGPATWGSG